MSQKSRLPTEEEFLEFVPKRFEFEWYENEDGNIVLKVPKFKSDLGKSFCKLIKKDDKFVANLDGLGSFVWLNIDGVKTIGEILKKLKKKFPEEENIKQRLFLFLQQMRGLNYIDY